MNEQEKKIQGMARLIEGSWPYRIAYWRLRLWVFIESFLWTLLDIVRIKRTHVAAKINRNYMEQAKEYKQMAQESKENKS